LYEELPVDQFKFSLGGRTESNTVDAGAWSKNSSIQNASFNPTSYALGGLYTFTPNWSLTNNLSHNERAPSYFELYANGAHLATGQYEVGNPNFSLERSNGIDAQIRWKDGKNSFSAGPYYTKFSSFIGLLNTGSIVTVQGQPLQEAKFTEVVASFTGFETEGKFNLNDNIDLKLTGDYVRATNLTSGEALPRIAPLRLSAGLQYQKNTLGARLNVLHAFAQERIAANELATNGYTNVGAMVTYKLPAKINVELFAKANNLLNQDIRDSASFLKDIAPQGARSLTIGLRSDF